EENVLLPLDLAGDGYSGADRARELLGRVGLADRGDHYPVQLSGGEQQRVALARAFIRQPPIIMADEPTGNLDGANGRHVLDMLLDLNRREQTTLILVTHDAELATYADRLITLRDGRVESDVTAPARDAAEAPEALSADSNRRCASRGANRDRPPENSSSSSSRSRSESARSPASADSARPFATCCCATRASSWPGTSRCAFFISPAP